MGKTLLIFAIAAGVAGFGQVAGAPSLNKAYQGAIAISGTATRGSGPVTVYDVSMPVKAKLGQATAMDKNGHFAVRLKPALVQGHQIVAIDGTGRSSATVTVLAEPGK